MLSLVKAEAKDVIARVWNAWKEVISSKTTQVAVGTAVFAPIATVLAGKVCVYLGGSCDVVKVGHFLLAGALKILQQSLKDFGATAAVKKQA